MGQCTVSGGDDRRQATSQPPPGRCGHCWCCEGFLGEVWIQEYSCLPDQALRILLRWASCLYCSQQAWISCFTLPRASWKNRSSFVHCFTMLWLPHHSPHLLLPHGQQLLQLVQLHLAGLGAVQGPVLCLSNSPTMSPRACSRVPTFPLSSAISWALTWDTFSISSLVF